MDISRLLIGLDCGTQSIRALLADPRGRTLALASRPTPTIAIGPGQAEYEPAALRQSVLEVLRELAQAVPPGGEIAGIACASMGEAVVLLDEAGRPLGRIITWFDRRTEPDFAQFVERTGAERLAALTGVPPDPTLTLCKLLWHRRTDPAGFARLRRVLNLADWVAWLLCGEAATDPSLASRTLMFDLGARAWAGEVLALAGLDPALLPPIRPSGTRLGPVRPEVLAETGLKGRPVVGVGGHDHVCGSFAAGATRPGVLLDSMGTAEALFRTVARPVMEAAAWRAGFWQGVAALDRPFAYIGAGINASGGAIEWFRGIAGNAERSALIAEAEAVAPGSSGVLFLPHLAYSPPPQVDLAARGAFLGLTSATTRGALFRAVLEGLAMEARLCVDAITALPGAGPPDEIRVIGGNTRNALLLRIKAAVFGRPLIVIAEPEATALGAALLGGLAAGLWPSLEVALQGLERTPRLIEPDAHWVSCYDGLFEAIYRRVYPALAPLSHALTRFAAGMAA
jgi:xylulokinase